MWLSHAYIQMDVDIDIDIGRYSLRLVFSRFSATTSGPAITASHEPPSMFRHVEDGHRVLYGNLDHAMLIAKGFQSRSTSFGIARNIDGSLQDVPCAS